jgi:hypothetical protein
MIWTFEQKVSAGDWTDQYYDHSNVDENADITEQAKQIIIDMEGLEKHQDRIKNGLRLFGKYYDNLWD